MAATGRSVEARGLSDSIVSDGEIAHASLVVSRERATQSGGIGDELNAAGFGSYIEGRGGHGRADAAVFNGRNCILFSDSGLAVTDGVDDTVVVRGEAMTNVYGAQEISTGEDLIRRLLKVHLEGAAPVRGIEIIFDDNGNITYSAARKRDYLLRFIHKKKDTTRVTTVLQDGIMAFSYDIGEEGDLRVLSADIIGSRIDEYGSDETLLSKPGFERIYTAFIAAAVTEKAVGAETIEALCRVDSEQLVGRGLGIDVPPLSQSSDSKEEAVLPEYPIADRTTQEVEESVFLPQPPPIDADTSLGMAVDWLMNSGVQNMTDDERYRGGVNGWYDMVTHDYGFLYSEISGYAITTLYHLYVKTGDREYLERAQLIGEWMLKVAMHRCGGVKTRLYYRPYEALSEGEQFYAFRNEVIFTFDTGIVLEGLINLYKATRERKYLEAALHMGEFILGMQRSDGFFDYAMNGETGETVKDDFGRWSRQHGAYHAKSITGLIDLYKLTGDDIYRAAAIRFCDAALAMQEESGRFITTLETNDTVMHPHCYAAEGLMYIGRELGIDRYVNAAWRATTWMFDNQAENGGVAQLYRARDDTFIDYQRSDILSQMLRLGLYFYSSEYTGGNKAPFFKKLERLRKRLEASQVRSGEQKGGFLYGTDIDGQQPFSINTWSSLFAIETLSKYKRIMYEEVFTAMAHRTEGVIRQATQRQKTYGAISEALAAQPDTKICFVLGTRPEIIKMWPVIRYCDEHNVPYFIIHSGQHYSENMSDSFFSSLRLPSPRYHFTRPAEALGRDDMLEWMSGAIAPLLEKEKPSIVFVQGDTNTVYAGALAAQSRDIPIGHIEAGMRSFDLDMPEELNRMEVGKLATYHFCPTDVQIENLRNEELGPDGEWRRLYATGNTIVDAVIMADELIAERETEPADVLSGMGVEENGYFLLTMHRPSNVDDKEMLERMIAELEGVSVTHNTPILFPIHPRTKARLSSFGLELPGCFIEVPPIDNYFTMLTVEKNARLIITDSGGIQEEAAALGVPSVVLRKKTDRVESTLVGAAMLAYPDTDLPSVTEAVDAMVSRERGWENPYGNGNAAEYIVKAALNVSLPEEIYVRDENETSREVSRIADDMLPVDGYERFLENNRDAISGRVNADEPVIIRVPVEVLDLMGAEERREVVDFLSALQERSASVMIELYHIANKVSEISEKIYRDKYRLRKRSTEGVKRSRENTVTLLPVYKGEDITETTILDRIGSLDLKPEDTILSPIGLGNDPVGIARGAVLGLRMMGIARQVRQADEDGRDLTEDQEFLDEIHRTVIVPYRDICDREDRERFSVSPRDIVGLATDNRNTIRKVLNKLARFLPIAPFDVEALRKLYELTETILTAA